jgi:hypothetical protein
MGTQLLKLNEIVGRILEVKNIPKMFKNHARRSPCGNRGQVHESYPKKIQG